MEYADAMEMIILSIHLVVCIALIGLVLLQRSEGGALGIGGGGGALMSGRGAADALAKMTYFAGGLFLIISLLLTVISGAARNATGGSVFDNLPTFSPPAITQPETPAAPAEEAPTAPDPTQSSVAQPQLASAAPEAAQPTSLGPAPAAAGERAGPLTNQPATASRQTPQQTAARTPSTPAATTRAASTAPTTVQRAPSTGGTTQSAANTPARTQPLRLPGSDQASAALNTVPLDAAQTPESSDNPLAPVRRERAGPDQ